MKERSDQPRPRGIRLISPDGHLVDVGEHAFETNPVTVGDLGLFYLTGSRENDWEDDNRMGITIKDGRLVKLPMAELNDLGLYDLSLTMRGSKLPLTCRVYPLPGQNLIIEAHMNLDEDPLNPDSLGRYVLFNTEDWVIPQEGLNNNYVLFVPRDPVLLSRFEFSFVPRQ